MDAYPSVFGTFSGNGPVGWPRMILLMHMHLNSEFAGGGRVLRWCWVNFQGRGVLLTWIIVEKGLAALTVGAVEGCLGFFSLIYHFPLLSPSLRETVRYRLNYCLKGPLSPKQPTNQSEFPSNEFHTEGFNRRGLI